MPESGIDLCFTGWINKRTKISPELLASEKGGLEKWPRKGLGMSRQGQRIGSGFGTYLMKKEKECLNASFPEKDCHYPVP